MRRYTVVMYSHAELHCLSNFSFLRGASHPEELVQRAAELGYAALALTDECSFAGIVRAHREIRRLELPLKLVIGAELQLADGPRLVLLVRDRAGYAALSRLITQARRAATKGEYRLCRDDLAGGLPGCFALLVPEHEHDALTDALWLRAAFGEYARLAIELADGPDDAARLAALLHIAEAAGVPALAATGVLMHDPARRRLADVLTATRLSCPLEAAGLALAPNASRHLHDAEALRRRYPQALLDEACAVAARCDFSLDELRYEYPDGLAPSGYTAASWLRKLVEDGLVWRYGIAPRSEAAQARIRGLVEYELALITELHYEAYFLTVHDIVQYARGQKILCQGRGSAANSAVCWALGITEVDPELGIMLFERFISRERGEPPDIDVDFEHERREEVIQYIYRKYGRERAALAATVIRYQVRGALRDVGRALGFPAHLLDRLSSEHQWFDGRRANPERIRAAGLDPQAPNVRLLLELTSELVGFPRHLSQHVGGFVIARGRLDELVPVENAAMADRTVIQWDKDDLDAVGLLKIDVLALGMLSCLRRTLAMVSDWRGWQLDLGNIPREVAGVYEMLSDADSVGVFQVESRAQMTMLPRLKPRRFYDLVVEVAIVRPGPIQGGMVHPYLKARERVAAGLPADYPRSSDARSDAAVRGVLERTLGVPIFQEQVMQLAVVAAGFKPGDADKLRRSMGAWRRKGELERYRAQLLDGMAARGFAPEFAQRLCDQIEGFGSYGFPESHAASFALLVYFSAWLKRFEPAAFLCGLLNSQPMGFYAPAQLIQDARRHGVVVRGPDVTASEWDCTLEVAEADGTTPALPVRPDPAARLGLRLVKGVSRVAMERLLNARRERAFASVDDLAVRAALEPAEVSRLAAAGALAALAGHRRQALWQAAALQHGEGVLAQAPVRERQAELAAPREGEELIADYARLGFTLGRHPLALLRERLAQMRFVTAENILCCADRQLARAAGLVTCRQRPGSANGTMFMTLEDETGVVNVIVSVELLERQRRELLGARLLGVYGQIRREGKVVHLVAGRVVDHSALLGALAARSRDFH